jgi:hypothetical protein
MEHASGEVYDVQNRCSYSPTVYLTESPTTTITLRLAQKRKHVFAFQ